MAFNLPGFRRNETNKSLTNVSNAFEDFYNEISGISPRIFSKSFDKGFIPDIDILESDSEYSIETELPGVNQKNIEVKLENNILTIKGQKSLENEKKDKNYYTRERVYGEFHRAVTLPLNIEEEKIAASFKDGVLIVKIPKKHDTNAKKVSINIM